MLPVSLSSQQIDCFLMARLLNKIANDQRSHGIEMTPEEMIFHQLEINHLIELAKNQTLAVIKPQ